MREDGGGIEDGIGTSRGSSAEGGDTFTVAEGEVGRGGGGSEWRG